MKGTWIVARLAISLTPCTALLVCSELTAAFMALCFPIPPVWAQSFNCSKASTAVERAICTDQNLRLLDSALGRQFSALVQNHPERREALQRSERAWLKSRDRECPTSDSHGVAPIEMCLSDAYRTRIQYLATASPEELGVANATGQARVSPDRKDEVCRALGVLRALEDYQITAFTARCAQVTPKTIPEVEGDPVLADVLIAGDFALGVSYYRLSAIYVLAKKLGDTKNLIAQEMAWDAQVRRRCALTSCLRAAEKDRLKSLMDWIRLHSDPLPDHWSGRQDATGCTDDRTDYFQVSFGVVGRSVDGQIEGSAQCTGKVLDEIDFSGTKAGNVAFVIFDAGFTNEIQPVEAAIVVQRGKAFWQMLTKSHVEDYTWEAADLRGQ